MLKIKAKRSVAAIIAAVAALLMVAACPRAAFAESIASDLDGAAHRFIESVSRMQPNYGSIYDGDATWNPNLHCFKGTPNADDAYIVGCWSGALEGIFDEYYNEEDNTSYVPRAVIEKRLECNFASVPDLRTRVPQPLFDRDCSYDEESDVFAFPRVGGFGVPSLPTEMIFYTSAGNETYDLYLKVALDRWSGDAVLLNPDQYVVHRLRVQRNGDFWRYLSFELLSKDAAGASPIEVRGDSGLEIRGDWKGIEGSLVTLVAEKLKKDAYDDAFLGISGLLGVFDVRLEVDNVETHDGFGKMTISFPVDSDANDYWIIIHHLHQDGSVTKHRAIARGGMVELDVTDLSSFALERGPKAPAGESGGDESDGETSYTGYTIEKTVDAPADGTTMTASPKTGGALYRPEGLGNVQAFQLAVAALLASVMAVRLKAPARRRSCNR